MGRRSINTTKSGKYMNPTDQARKEARKKELKKNKRQRQMVRAAVLKGKDPGQILEEMEKIDEMEYNVLQPSPLNEKVLREKRKKLKETFDRVMRLYHNDDPELWAELKRKEVDYEKKRLKKQQYYESVKSAQSVQIDEIPLPQMNIPPPGGAPMIGSLNRVPPPSALHIPPFIPDLLQGNSNKYGESMTTKQTEKSLEKKKKDPPGCPPGPPPDLTKFRELDSDAEDEISIQELIKKTKSKKNLDDERLIPKDDDDSSKSTSIQQKLVQTTGQNIDAFMKEIENVQRNSKKQDSKENSDKDSQKSSDDENENDNNNDGDEDDDDIDDDDDEDSVNSENSEDDEDQQQKPPARKNTDKEQSNLLIPLPPIPPPPPAMGMPGGPPPPPIGMPPAMMFRPPPMRPGGGGGGGAIPGITMRMPPGPPPGRPGMQMQHRMGIRMPPGPPPGMPPNRGGMHHHNQKGHHHNHPAKDSKGITTITAKPQIRNLSADVTRFLPSALRVKRDDQKVPATKRPKQYHQEIRPAESKKGATKDDAYMQFMREMQGLL